MCKACPPPLNMAYIEPLSNRHAETRRFAEKLTWFITLSPQNGRSLFRYTKGPGVVAIYRTCYYLFPRYSTIASVLEGVHAFQMSQNGTSNQKRLPAPVNVTWKPPTPKKKGNYPSGAMQGRSREEMRDRAVTNTKKALEYANSNNPPRGAQWTSAQIT